MPGGMPRTENGLDIFRFWEFTQTGRIEGGSHKKKDLKSRELLTRKSRDR